MKENFTDCLARVLVHEGGWADHPKDPGGATMKGVTLATFRRHFGARKSKNQLRNITQEQLESIYKAGYWDKCLCDQLPAGLDYAVFDAAVNSGPGRSAKWLQAAIGAKQDGAIGPKTLAKTKQEDPVEVTSNMCDQRLSFLQHLSTWSTFGKGWGKRVAHVKANALAMAQGLMSPVETTTEFEIVRKGSEGEWVKKLQKALGLNSDGIFGKITEKYLKAWQKEEGLVVDGVAGRNTFRAMGIIS